MSSKLLPALGAALLLAACDTTGDAGGNQPPAAQPPQIATIQSNPDPNATAWGTAVADTVHFDTDSASLNADAQAMLQKQAAWLLQNRQHMITIEGHADERGTREYNLALGERRAEAVVTYLGALGVDPTRLKEVSYGKERPICADASEACWHQNRRSVTTLDN